MSAMSAGMTLKELAEGINLPVSLMYQYVRGITNVPPEVIEAVASTTKLNIEFFDPELDPRSSFYEATVHPDTLRMRADTFALSNQYLDKLSAAYAEPQRNVRGYMDVLQQKLSDARTRNDRAAEGEHLLSLGDFLSKVGNFEEARTYLDMACDVFQDLGLTQRLHEAQLSFARCLSEVGAVNAAMDYCDQIAKRGTVEHQIRASLLLAQLHIKRRKTSEALKATIQTAEIIEKNNEDTIENRHGIRRNLAAILNEYGHYDAALTLCRMDAQDYMLDNDIVSYVGVLLNLSQIQVIQGMYGEAIDNLEKIITLSRFYPDIKSKCIVALNMLAAAYAGIGRTAEAKSEARTAMLSSGENSEQYGPLIGYLALAKAHLEDQQFEDAISLADQTIRDAQRWRINCVIIPARIIRNQTMMRLQANKSQEVDAQSFNEAANILDAAQRNGSPFEILISRMNLAQCLVQVGNLEAAEKEAFAALEILDNGAVQLESALMGKKTELPMMLREPLMNLVELMNNTKLNLPEIRWRVHLLIYQLLKQKGAPAEELVEHLNKASEPLFDILSHLAPKDSDVYLTAHPELEEAFKDYRALVAGSMNDASKERLVKAYRYGILSLEV
jgi:tetratricopeptide (TPR) repeat protein